MRVKQWLLQQTALTTLATLERLDISVTPHVNFERLDPLALERTGATLEVSRFVVHDSMILKEPAGVLLNKDHRGCALRLKTQSTRQTLRSFLVLKALVQRSHLKGLFSEW